MKKIEKKKKNEFKKILDLRDKIKTLYPYTNEQRLTYINNYFKLIISSDIIEIERIPRNDILLLNEIVHEINLDSLSEEEIIKLSILSAIEIILNHNKFLKNIPIKQIKSLSYIIQKHPKYFESLKKKQKTKKEKIILFSKINEGRYSSKNINYKIDYKTKEEKILFYQLFIKNSPINRNKSPEEYNIYQEINQDINKNRSILKNFDFDSRIKILKNRIIDIVSNPEINIEEDIKFDFSSQLNFELDLMRLELEKNNKKITRNQTGCIASALNLFFKKIDWNDFYETNKINPEIKLIIESLNGILDVAITNTIEHFINSKSQETKLANFVEKAGEYLIYIKVKEDYFRFYKNDIEKWKEDVEKTENIPRLSVFFKKNYTLTKKNNSDVGAIIVSLLEKSGIIDIIKKYEDKREIGYITIKKEYEINKTLKSLYKLTNSPMIEKPSNWIYDEDLRNYTSGGNRYNKLTRYKNLAFSKELNNISHNNLDNFLNSFRIIELSRSGLENINWLQSIPYKINFPLLTYICRNLVKYFEKNSLFSYNSKSFEDWCSKGIFPKIKDKEKYLLYKKDKVAVLEILQTLIIALSFSNKKLFFQISLDPRGRLMFNGYPIGPHQGALGRSLLIFDEGEHVWYDVVASGLQIISGLTGDNNDNLRYTFFYKSSDKDIYSKISEKAIELFDEKNLKIDLNRKIVKYTAIKFSYNQGFKSLCEDLSNDHKYIIDTFSEKNKISVFESVSIIATTLRKAVIEVMPETNLLKKLFNLSIDLIDPSKEILFETNYFCNIAQFYPRTREKRIHIPNLRKQKSITYREAILPLSQDLDKLKSALSVNFIHHLDSQLAMSVIKKCAENNITICTIHDCFGVLPENVNKLKEFYYESFVDLIIKNNPLKNYYEFILKNSQINYDYYTPKLSKLKKNKGINDMTQTVDIYYNKKLNDFKEIFSKIEKNRVNIINNIDNEKMNTEILQNETKKQFKPGFLNDI